MGVFVGVGGGRICCKDPNPHTSRLAAYNCHNPPLLQQMAPITIREVVQQFKDRIQTERDKTEFKSLCDRYTVVVE